VPSRSWFLRDDLEGRVRGDRPVGLSRDGRRGPATLPKRSAGPRLPASTAPADLRPNDQLRRNATALPLHVTMSHTPLHRHSPVGKSGAVRPEPGLAPSGHCVLQLQEQRLRGRSGSRPIRLISLEISRPGPIRGGLMIWGSRCLPHVPPEGATEIRRPALPSEAEVT
jgi:hypothetical protein